jgi:hypothetical protein
MWKVCLATFLHEYWKEFNAKLARSIAGFVQFKTGKNKKLAHNSTNVSFKSDILKYFDNYFI